MVGFVVRILLFWRFVKFFLLLIVTCNIEIICLFSWYDGLSNVKCPKAQSWRNKVLLYMWVVNRHYTHNCCKLGVVSLFQIETYAIFCKYLPCHYNDQLFCHLHNLTQNLRCYLDRSLINKITLNTWEPPCLKIKH